MIETLDSGEDPSERIDGKLRTSAESVGIAYRALWLAYLSARNCARAAEEVSGAISVGEKMDREAEAARLARDGAVGGPLDESVLDSEGTVGLLTWVSADEVGEMAETLELLLGFRPSGAQAVAWCMRAARAEARARLKQEGGIDLDMAAKF